MPIYEYRCENGHTFEALQSMSDDALTHCTECGAPVKRVLHSPAIHFKGSGFYNTDYGTRSRNKAKEAASAEGSSSGASGSDSGSGSGKDSGSSSSASSSSGSGSGSGSGSSEGSSGKPKASSTTE